MPSIVSVIHGARALLESRSVARRWMRLFSGRLRSRGVSEVFCFEWSGGYLRSLLPTAAERYADHLRAVSEAAGRYSPRASIFIHAKSNGALIAERALRSIALSGPEIQICCFLRAGVPDPRKVPNIPGVSRIVSVVSKDDALYWRGLFAWRILGLDRWYQDSANPIEHDRITLEGLDHGDLNYPCYLEDPPESDLFDLYVELLAQRRATGQASMEPTAGSSPFRSLSAKANEKTTPRTDDSAGRSDCSR